MDFHMQYQNGKLERINCHADSATFGEGDRDTIHVGVQSEGQRFTISVGEHLCLFIDKEQAGDLAVQLEKALGWPDYTPTGRESLVDKPENPPAESAEAAAREVDGGSPTTRDDIASDPWLEGYLESLTARDAKKIAIEERLGGPTSEDN